MEQRLERVAGLEVQRVMMLAILIADGIGCGASPLCLQLLGRPASDSGTLCHVDGDQGRRDRRRRAFMLPILLDRTEGRLPILTVPRNEHAGDRDKSRRRRVTVSGCRAHRRNGGTWRKSATGQGEPSPGICKRLRIGALERGIDPHGLELFTLDCTTGGGSR
jgi:hypothetical protein